MFNPTSKKEMEAALAISKFLRSNVGSTLKKEGVTTIAYRGKVLSTVYSDFLRRKTMFFS